jgi:hypothetical protein
MLSQSPGMVRPGSNGGFLPHGEALGSGGLGHGPSSRDEYFVAASDLPDEDSFPSRRLSGNVSRVHRWSNSSSRAHFPRVYFQVELRISRHIIRYLFGGHSDVVSGRKLLRRQEGKTFPLGTVGQVPPEISPTDLHLELASLGHATTSPLLSPSFHPRRSSRNTSPLETRKATPGPYPAETTRQYKNRGRVCRIECLHPRGEGHARCVLPWGKRHASTRRWRVSGHMARRSSSATVCNCDGIPPRESHWAILGALLVPAVVLRHGQGTQVPTLPFVGCSRYVILQREKHTYTGSPSLDFNNFVSHKPPPLTLLALVWQVSRSTPTDFTRLDPRTWLP